MSSNDVFNVIVSLSFVAIAASVVFLAVRINSTLNEVDDIVEEIKGVTNEIEIFKKGLKMGLVTLITGLASKLVNKPAKEVKSDE